MHKIDCPQVIECALGVVNRAVSSAGNATKQETIFSLILEEVSLEEEQIQIDTLLSTVYSPRSTMQWTSFLSGWVSKQQSTIYYVKETSGDIIRARWVQLRLLDSLTRLFETVLSLSTTNTRISMRVFSADGSKWDEPNFFLFLSNCYRYTFFLFFSFPSLCT